MEKVPISIGELFDKYTILKIKQDKITDVEKLGFVETELSYLQPLTEKYEIDKDLITRLHKINESLWSIEDKLREKEGKKEFDKEFIELARSVYTTNDKRSIVKKIINTKMKSPISEVKSYAKYENKQVINKDLSVKELLSLIEKNKKTQNYSECIKYSKKLLELKPDNVEYLKELGNLYENTQSYTNAIKSYEKIIKNPTITIQMRLIILNQIGMCYSSLRKFEDSIEYFNKICMITREIPDVYYNLGVCYTELKKYEKSKEMYEKISENHDKSLFNLGQIYYYLKDYDKSIECYTKYLKKTGDARKYSLSHPYLGKKDFKNGFLYYEERLKKNDIKPQTKLQERVNVPGVPYWNGKDDCKSLLIMGEQGLGDNIQYYRFIIELSKKFPNMKITFFCKKELAHIFKTYENIEIKGQLFLVDYNAKAFIMSIPYLLNKTSIKANTIDYIKTNPKKLDTWRTKLNTKKLKVGFVYDGKLISFIDKTIPLEKYKVLTELDIELICIHMKDEVKDDFKRIDFKDKLTHYDIDKEMPFEDTIHILKNIDLLVTIDTYIVHLAGVMGIKTWLLLGTSEWRWSNDEKRTYWYDSVELIRTKKYDKLEDLLKTVNKRIKSELL